MKIKKNLIRICSTIVTAMFLTTLAPIQAMANTTTKKITQVVFGNNHALILYSDKTVSAAGGNEFGQLGDGTLTSRNVFQPVLGLTDVKEIAAGFRVSMALLEDGTIKIWGNDFYDNRTNSPKTPITIAKIPNAKHIYMSPFSCYAKTAFILKDDGSVDQIDYQNKLKSNVLTGVKKIAVSGDVNNSNWATFLMEDNSLKIWQDYHAFDDFRIGTAANTFADIPGATDVADIYPSHGNIIYKKIDGTVMRAYQHSSVKTFVEMPEAKNAKFVTTGVGSTLIINDDGTLIGKSIYGNSCEVPSNLPKNVYHTLATDVDVLINTVPSVNGTSYSYGLAFTKSGNVIKLNAPYNITDPVDMSEFLTRLGISPLDIATSAVSTAEKSYLEDDYNKALGLVNDLPDSAEKTVLQDRLDVLRNLIDQNNEKLILATQAVEKAERTRQQSDIDEATALVNSLLNTPDKTILQDRLSAITATLKVEIAETTNAQSDVDEAKTLVNVLREGTIKTSLLDRLNVVQNIINAIKAVENAEKQMTDVSIISARSLVDALPDSSIKTSLTNRLDEIQRIVATPDDNGSPNAPTITDADSVVTITATDNGGQKEGYATKLDDFETDTFKNELIGNWERSSKQKYTGAYSLKSATISHSRNTSSQFSFTVPQGTNGSVSFKYRVSSESSYDFLNVYIDGARVIRTSGNGSWLSFSKQLTAGTHTVKFEYTKNGSRSYYDDAAYIDDLSVTHWGIVPSLPSGIKLIQYRVNNGEWLEYKGSFTPSVSGEVTITARAIDFADNVGPESTTVITIENNGIQQINNNIDLLEKIITDLKTQEQIDNANAMIQETQDLIDALPDGPEKTSLQDSLDEIKNIVDTAQKVLDATNKVIDAENIVKDLSTQELVDNAQSVLDDALQLVNAVPTEDIKNSLLDRLSDIQSKIDIANAILKTSDAESTITQEAVDTANSSINKLPDGELKSDLQDRLDAVQAVIDAEKDVIAAEEEVADFGDLLGKADLTYDSGNTPEELQEKLNIAKEKTNKANDTINRVPATNNASLVGKLNNLKDRNKTNEGLNKSTQKIVTDSLNNHRARNGTSPYRIKGNTGTNLVDIFSKEIVSNLGSLENLHWVSFDHNLATVENGVITAVHKGVAKISVYNDKGVMDMFIVISNGNRSK